MTVANPNIPSQQGPGALFHHFVLAVCLILLLPVGSDIVSIVLWQSPMAKKIEILTLVPIFAITLLYCRHLIRGVTASPEITALVIFAVLSVAWSDYPLHSLERSVPLVVTTAFGLVLGSMMSLRGLFVFLAVFFSISLVLALGAIITLPQARGIPPWVDTWNGIYSHKNEFGLASMAALLTCYFASKQFSGRLKALFLAGMALALFLLVASESRTSQANALISMTALLVCQALPQRETIWAIGYALFLAFLISLAAFLLTSTIAEPLFTLIGRNPTLSDRIPTWGLVWPFVLERFWIGWGYIAHWYESAPHLRAYTNRLDYLPHYSHNGLLETFLNVGFVGVVLTFCVFFRFFFNIFYCMRYIRQRDAFVFAFVLGMAYFFANITESTILGRMSASWVFFVAYTTKMSLVAKALRATARANYAAVT